MYFSTKISVLKLADETIFDILNELEKQGRLQKLQKQGFVPCNICTHVEFYRWFQARKYTGSRTTELVLEADEKFKLCRSYAFKIIRKFKK